MSLQPVLVDDGIPTSDPFTGWANYFSLSPTPPDGGKPTSIVVTSNNKLKVNGNPAVTQVIIGWSVSGTPYISTITGNCKLKVGGSDVIRENDIGIGSGIATVVVGAGDAKCKVV